MHKGSISRSHLIIKMILIINLSVIQLIVLIGDFIRLLMNSKLITQEQMFKIKPTFHHGLMRSITIIQISQQEKSHSMSVNRILILITALDLKRRDKYIGTVTLKWRFWLRE